MMTILVITAEKCAMERARVVIKLTVCVKLDAILAGKGYIVKKVKETLNNLQKIIKHDNNSFNNAMQTSELNTILFRILLFSPYQIIS